MKFLIAFLALVALTGANAGGLEELGEHQSEHHAALVIHGEPVVTHVFETPGQAHFTNWAPKIEGKLEGRGFGPHIQKHEGY